MNKKILHIVRDEKFIDSAVEIFSCIDGVRSDFLIIGNKKSSLQYIKKSKIKVISPSQFVLLIPFFNFYYSGIVFHAITGDFIKAAILRLSSRLKIVWIGWGFDYLGYSNNNFQKKITSEFLSANVPPNKIKPRSSVFRLFSRGYSWQRLFRRIDYFAPVLEEELQYLPVVSDSKMAFVDWNYLALEDHIIKGFEEKVVCGHNLLLGNSGSPANNHLDSFEDIKLFDFGFDQIICPLSYGLPVYRKSIGKIGSEMFGSKFQPIYEFLPYPEYVTNLLSCKYLFINSKRQLGMGNIILMLYLGAKVILDTSNPAFDFFSKNGIKVYSIEEARSGCMKDFDLNQTRIKLKQIWGKEVIIKKTKDLLKVF